MTFLFLSKRNSQVIFPLLVAPDIQVVDAASNGKGTASSPGRSIPRFTVLVKVLPKAHKNNALYCNKLCFYKEIRGFRVSIA